MEETLRDARCPTFLEHLEKYGPDRWDRTAGKIKSRNLLFSQPFQAMAKLLRLHEKDHKTWHMAAIDGHSKFNKLFPLSRNEANHLQAMNIITVSHLYETDDLGNLRNCPNVAQRVPTPILLPPHDWRQIELWALMLLSLAPKLVQGWERQKEITVHKIYLIVPKVSIKDSYLSSCKELRNYGLWLSCL